MSDPLLRETEAAFIIAIAGSIVVMLRRWVLAIAKGMKRLWSMARGNGITKEELRVSQEMLKSDLLEAIKTSTYPIQPTSNSGTSLPDLFNLLGDMEQRLTRRNEIQDKKLDSIQDTASRTSASLEAHIATHPRN